jgi:catechol 2,3-dioxygenase-like lactoylglutathione lyase family enzyme
MAKSSFGHIQINIDPENISFYKNLLTFMGWNVIMEEPVFLGIGDSKGDSLWFTPPMKEAGNDYDGIGMNHLALTTDTQADVDEAVEYLKKNGIKPLFDTPRHRPEFCGSPDQTYYQVMFESPDRVLIEVVYTGPKS